MADWAKSTVVDLRAELKRRGLAHAGKKAELVSRLEESDQEVALEEPDQETAIEESEGGIALEEHKPEETKIASEESKPEETKPEDKETAPEDATESKGNVPVPQPGSTEADLLVENVPEEPQAAEPTLEELDPLDQSKNTDSTPSLDTQNRKRRSRTPTTPPEEISRKRARISSSTAVEGDSTSEAIRKNAQPDEPMEQAPNQIESFGQGLEKDSWRDTSDAFTRDANMEEEADVAPALHPATSALYIKNFMRPLRSDQVREHLIELATPPRAPVDPNIVTTFHLDQIRTHAFAEFTSIAAASRARIGLHGKVWPDERNRKQLWVDFVPPEKVGVWIEEEQAAGGTRGNLKRWEVVYEQDDGITHASLIELGSADSAPAQSLEPKVPPTGPGQIFPGIEAAPKGPRGRNPPPNRDASGSRTTEARPFISYRPVAPELAEERINAMRSFYTHDKDRDMGAEDEINRYTFENSANFVDRGKEVFIGIRPPHREHERSRDPRREPRGEPRSEFRGEPRGDPWRNPRFEPRGGAFRPSSDRFRGMDDRAPRSRFTGEPLPTFENRFDRRGRGGGGRFRSDRY